MDKRILVVTDLLMNSRNTAWETTNPGSNHRHTIDLLNTYQRQCHSTDSRLYIQRGYCSLLLVFIVVLLTLGKTMKMAPFVFFLCGLSFISWMSLLRAGMGSPGERAIEPGTSGRSFVFNACILIMASVAVLWFGMYSAVSPIYWASVCAIPGMVISLSFTKETFRISWLT